jgi:hypothetical protein
MSQGLAAFGSEANSLQKSGEPTYELRLAAQKIKFNPCSSNGLANLEHWIATVLPTKRARPEAAESDDAPSVKHLRRGLQEIGRLTAQLRKHQGSTSRDDLIFELLELVQAVNNNQRPPVPEKIEAFTVPHLLTKKMSNPVGRGLTPATNLQPSTGADLSLRDPKPTTFWRRPDRISSQNMYFGFGRTNRFELMREACRYSNPKESSGLNPGFEVESAGTVYKIKFGEVSSEPFAARIFDALGYHVDPTDYCDGVKVQYDRRMFLEFHSRKPLTTRFTLFGFIPIHTLEMQKHFDPFNYIAFAVLRNGQRWSGAELKAHLLRDSKRGHPEKDAENFNPEVEAQIDYLVTKAANVQEKETVGKNIGPWDFGQLDHADRREIRGAGLLAAWLGWFDTRFDNTRVRVLRSHGQTELVHYFSDLGGVLGETSGWLYSRGERPNAFPWTFTRSPGCHERDGLPPLRLHGYKPLEPTAAFTAMTMDDARWMGRLIAQLTEPQILEALVGSGYASAEAKLYLEKLLSRRDRMLCDLGLENEVRLFHPSGYNRKFDYEPAKDGPITVSFGGQKISAAVGGKWVKQGKLK